MPCAGYGVAATSREAGRVRPEELSAQGLFFPNPYIVPGGRFNEMYGWDSYFILLGLEAEHREKLAKGIVDNFLFEIEHYGGVLNANRTYYLTRSQPPFLTSMIRAVVENQASFAATPAGRAEARMAGTGLHAGGKGLFHLDAAGAPGRCDPPGALLGLWLRPGTGNGRCEHLLPGRNPATGTASEPGITGFLVKGSEHPDTGRIGAVKADELRCEGQRCVSACVVRRVPAQPRFLCGRSRHAGVWIRYFQPFWAVLGRDRGLCTGVPKQPALSLRARYGALRASAGRRQGCAALDRRANGEKTAIHRYLWRPKEGVFRGLDFRPCAGIELRIRHVTLSALGGCCFPRGSKLMEAKAQRFRARRRTFDQQHEYRSQWDEPYGWAPTNWLAVAGLDAEGFRTDAARIAEHFDATVDQGFASDGTIREKYNVVAGNAQVTVSTGYTQNVVGFGWTNAVYLKMREIVEEEEARAAVDR